METSHTCYYQVYRLVINYNSKIWDVFKKHNEFEDFHNDLHIKYGVAFSDFKKIDEILSLDQRKGRSYLERYIEGIMYFDDVVNSDTFKDFIQFENCT